jgi:hypothetical protein
MHLDLIQSVSLAGKSTVPNDDRAGSAHRHAWVIDGATDLGPPGLMGERGGAAWLATEAQRAFAGASGGMEAICVSVFDEVAAAYARDRTRDPVAAWELPRASLAAVALEDRQLACAVINDCTVIHRGAHGMSYLTPAPDRQDERAEAEALGPGVGAEAIRSEAVLTDRRMARQMPKPVLSIDAGEAARVTRYSRAAIAPGDDIVLMTDGFSALIETYKAYDLHTLMAGVLERGLGGLAEDLRRIEREDAACLRYPRFKASDDATAIWVRVAG